MDWTREPSASTGDHAARNRRDQEASQAAYNAIRAAFQRSQAAQAAQNSQSAADMHANPTSVSGPDPTATFDPPGTSGPYTIVAPPYEPDTSISPLHRRLFQAVLVACHVRLRASWGPAFAHMHPPAIGRWSRDEVASGLRAFEASEAAGGRESVLAGLALALVEDPEEGGEVETVLIGMLRGMGGEEEEGEGEEGGS
ncbi:hypothetical protein EDC01DRAFT_782383 [Geopyxis carbonaria]|nr:hypothetical protein EDC01DRAFT_782383 [Geopyxis carbonaria]